MRNLFTTVSVFLVIVMLAVAMAVPAVAQERSTPVTVQNPVDIDSTNNTVKAQQSGPWNTTVSGSVSVSNTPNVTVTNTPSVSIANTPGVSVTNVPTVAISPTNNTVSTTSAYSFIKPWTTDTVVANGATVSSAIMNCGGFKEIRTVVAASIPSNPQLVKVSLNFRSGNGGYQAIGAGNFAEPTVPITPYANYTTANAGLCYISHPVISDTFIIRINNTSGNSITLSSNTWVYLTN